MRFKSKRSNECDISPKVKKIVWERDGHKCIYCGSYYARPDAHFKRRSQGGLGIEQNVVTLCYKCHTNYDNGFFREELENYIREYLKSIYGTTWCESELIYNKWKDFKYF